MIDGHAIGAVPLLSLHVTYDLDLITVKVAQCYLKVVLTIYRYKNLMIKVWLGSGDLSMRDTA